MWFIFSNYLTISLVIYSYSIVYRNQSIQILKSLFINILFIQKKSYLRMFTYSHNKNKFVPIVGIYDIYNIFYFLDIQYYICVLNH